MTVLFVDPGARHDWRGLTQSPVKFRSLSAHSGSFAGLKVWPRRGAGWPRAQAVCGGEQDAGGVHRILRCVAICNYGRLRADILNAYGFLSLADAVEKLEDSRRDLYQQRPHGAIGNKVPAAFMKSAPAASPCR